MEFKLNKIDTELRRQIQEVTKEGIIHHQDGVQINRDKKKEKEQKHQPKKFKQENKKLVIQVMKTETIEINAFQEDGDQELTAKGKLLDVRK